MKLLFERLIETECTTLQANGLEPSPERLSQLISQLASPEEIAQAFRRWNAQQPSMAAQHLCQTGISGDLARVFTAPISRY